MLLSNQSSRDFKMVGCGGLRKGSSFITKVSSGPRFTGLIRSHRSKYKQKGSHMGAFYYGGVGVVIEREESVGELITQLRLDIRELMTEVKSLKSMSDKMEDIRDRTIKAEDSSKSAHLRLNAHDKIIFWAGTTIIGGLIIGAITLLYKIQGG